MSKLIYIQGDDNELLDVLMRTLRDHGYNLQYGDIKNAEAVGQLHTDIALLCIPKATDPALLTFADISIDEMQHSVRTEDGTVLHITPTEFGVLRYLVERQHQAVSREDLIPAVWGFESKSGSRVADDTVKRLRRKLQATRVRIETVWGFGFKLREAE